MLRSEVSNKTILTSTLVFLLLLVLAFALRKMGLHHEHGEQLAEKFTARLHQKELALDQLLAELERDGKIEESGSALFHEEGLALYQFEGEELLYWSNNAVPIELLDFEPTDIKRSRDGRDVRRNVELIGNGYYEVVQAGSGGQKIIGLILIKEQRPYQNKYLENNFQSDFDLHPDMILVPPGDGGSDISSIDGTVLVGLAMPAGSASRTAQWVLLFLDLLKIIVFLYWLQALIKRFENKIKPFGIFAIYTTILIAARTIFQSSSLPETDGLTLFDPALYATSAMLPSLGDLLINVLMLLFIARAFHIARKHTRSSGEGLANIGAALSILAFLALASMVTHVITGLIDNSRIDHNINDVLGISIFSVLSVTAMGALLYVLFLFADIVAELCYRKDLSEGRLWLIVLLASGLSILAHHFLGMVDLALVLWPLFMLAVPLRIRRNPRSRYDMSAAIALLVLVSVFSAYVISKYTDRKEKTDRVVFAERLSNDEDPIAELLFDEQVAPLVREAQILSEFQKSDSLFDLAVVNTAVNKTFSGYWSKYSIGVFTFSPAGLPLGNYDKAPERTIEDVHEVLKRSDPIGQKEERLRYLPDRPEEVRYVSWLEIEAPEDSVRLGYIYLEFSNKQMPAELGFPELLLAHDPDRVDDLGEYSFARYENGALVRKYGGYPYLLQLNGSVSQELGPIYFVKNGYMHLAYRSDAATVVLLSLERRSFIAEITAFSYLFSFFSLILFLSLSFVRFRSGMRFYSLGLRSKVQVMFVSLVLISLLLLATGLRYYINEQYTEKNHALIREKIHSVLIEVGHKMEGEAELTKDHSSYLDHILTKFSNVFFTDINLYDLNGDLLATSRSKVFKEGLIGQKMDPDAFDRLSKDGASEFVHDERIGKLKYLSAYVPFQNKNDEVLAYLNLPYFAKQNELEKEVSNFLEAIINAFVILFALSILAGLAVSNWITRPLQLLREHLSATDLGESNEPIKYKGSDEIAALVAEYNRKVEELKISAAKLARSERESAWREMAKQVAHEIKNPLTPMKLSVQHFQRTWDPGSTDSKTRLDRFTENMVEQIEILSNIAGEFSNFAKMPIAKNEVFSLLAVLKSVVGLYNKSEWVDVSFDAGKIEDANVFADSDQMHRVFNNLVKNAIEAIPDGAEGEIQIHVERDNEYFEVAIRDNGVGIPKERYEQIFVPSFTTRSTGMGLGLAIVKNIVEGAGGSVRFTSEEGKGSAFFVRLPAYTPKT